MAAAPGVNLSHVAGVASRLDGNGAERSLTRDERKLGIRDVPLTARGRQTRGMRRPDWSAADAGQAACGLGKVPFAAACYSYAGAREDHHWVLWSALSREAQRIARREHWPPQVVGNDGRRKFYRENLADLVLTEDANKHLFMAAPQLYAVVLDVALWFGSATCATRSDRSRAHTSAGWRSPGAPSERGSARNSRATFRLGNPRPDLLSGAAFLSKNSTFVQEKDVGQPLIAESIGVCHHLNQ